MSVQSGTTLAHYRLLDKIGEGGMGVVYRARDEHLSRAVAIKILPARALGDVSARQRFRKEALALSRLNHPNIATVHDFDTEGDEDFLVMEYVPGSTLSEKIREGPLDENEVVRLARQLAEGLAAAHRAGIVHRDLKPANLRVTPDGRLKILDFGLAKLFVTASETATTETQTRGMVGTVPYMAPEQLGGQPIDARTDVYAAGNVLYEMITGHRPFRGTDTARLLYAIAHDSPPSPRSLGVKISSALEAVVSKALEKEPERRYASGAELEADLRRLEAGTAVAAPSPRRGRTGRRVLATAAAGLVAVAVIALLRLSGVWSTAVPEPVSSLAVLPLENLSGDPAKDYFADGMTDALINDLNKISALTVIARPSVMRFKGGEQPPAEIAAELGVEALVVGSVIPIGERARINVRLVDARDERLLWSNSYERGLADILTLQGEIARTIAAEVRVTLTTEEEVELSAGRQVAPEVFEAYLKGRFHSDKETKEGFERAIEHFEHALTLDPRHAPSWVGLHGVYDQLFEFGYPPEETEPKARDALNRALEIDDTLGEAHAALAKEKLKIWDWIGAERDLRRATELDPNDPTVLSTMGLYLTIVGRFDEAIATRHRAIRLNPLMAAENAGLGWTYFFAGRYDDAIAQLREALELHPDEAYAREVLSWCYAMKGMHEESIVEAERGAGPTWRETPETVFTLGWVYGLAGQHDRARECLLELTALSERVYVDPWAFACIHAGLGENETAFEWLEKGYEERSDYMVLAKVAPLTPSLRADPRMDDLVRRMGFPGSDGP